MSSAASAPQRSGVVSPAPPVRSVLAVRGVALSPAEISAGVAVRSPVGAMTAPLHPYLATPRARPDPAVREQLLLEHLPQVRYIARRIHDRLPAQILLDDLVHAGVLGLIDAVAKFDPAKNVQLKSYAQFRIRGAILDSLRAMDWSPRHLRRQARRVEQANRDLRARLGRVPTELELAKEVELGLEEFQHLLGELRGLDIGSLESGSPGAPPAEQPSNQRPGDPERDPFSLCLHSEMSTLVAHALEDLDVKKRHVITLYYLQELTMKEVGAVLGIGESRVSQIHSAALIRLRSRMEDSIRSRGCHGVPASKAAGMARRKKSPAPLLDPPQFLKSQEPREMARTMHADALQFLRTPEFGRASEPKTAGRSIKG